MPSILVPLQVFILKGVSASGEWRVASGEKDLGGGVTPLSRVFWEKRLQAVENKGQELLKKGKEAASD